MNPEYEKRLETEIHRELKGLPELTAPRTLSSRVMAAIEASERAPWYKQPWLAWPWAAQAASLSLMLALFGVLCFVALRLPLSEPVLAIARPVGQWFSGAMALSNALNAMAGSLLLLLKNLHAGVIAAVLLALAFAYALCIGLGTLYVRLGFARR